MAIPTKYMAVELSTVNFNPGEDEAAAGQLATVGGSSLDSNCSDLLLKFFLTSQAVD